jgi:hypothetical protein
MIVYAAGLTATADYPIATPIFGWRNLADSITATSSDADHPASYLANPSTAQYWQAEGVGSPATPPTVTQYLTATPSSAAVMDYLAIAGHNLGTAGAVVSAEGANGDTRSLLHLDGTDGATTITDETGRAWTASGNAQIDTAQSKFGGSSLLLDGTGDYITTASSTDLNLGSSDFTVDFWFQCTAAGGTMQRLCGRRLSSGLVADMEFSVERTTANVIRGGIGMGSTFESVSSTTQFTNALNTGWHHCAFVRDGSTLRLFIDGVQEATEAITGAANTVSADLGVGSQGGLVTNPWTGWIDEFRLSVGVARWTSNFTPPTSAYNYWAELVGEYEPTDDAPLLFRWSPQSLAAVRLKIAEGGSPAAFAATPRAAVLYAGALLVMPRGLSGDTHAPIALQRTRRMLTNRSETGQFIGRYVLSQSRSTGYQFQFLDEDFYRSEMDPFLDAASAETPFFAAWKPQEEPADVGYCWLTSDPEPTRHRPTGTMAVTLQVGGFAI